MYCEGTADILDAHGCGVDTHVFIYTHTPSASAARRYPVNWTILLKQINEKFYKHFAYTCILQILLKYRGIIIDVDT